MVLRFVPSFRLLCFYYFLITVKITVLISFSITKQVANVFKTTSEIGVEKLKISVNKSIIFLLSQTTSVQSLVAQKDPTVLFSSKSSI